MLSTADLWTATHHDRRDWPLIVQRSDGFQVIRITLGRWHGHHPDGSKVRHPRTGKVRAWSTWYMAAARVDEQHPPTGYAPEILRVELTIDQRRLYREAFDRLPAPIRARVLPKLCGMTLHTAAPDLEACGLLLAYLDTRDGRAAHNLRGKVSDLLDGVRGTATTAEEVQAFHTARTPEPAPRTPEPAPPVRKRAPRPPTRREDIQDRMRAWIRHPDNDGATLGDLARAFDVDVATALRLRDGKGAQP